MADSKFWRCLGIAFVASLFYLGHGLHDPAGSVLPSLETELHAGDVATASHSGNSSVKIITSSDDGKTINVWSGSTSTSSVRFIGTFPAVKRK